MKNYPLFASGYTASQPGEGVVLLELSSTGLKKIHSWTGLANPSYILPVEGWLYGVEELKNQASVVKISLDHPDQNYKRFPVSGSGLCHICRQNGYLFTTGYTGGSLTALDEQGTESSFIQHKGHSVNPVRQEKAHAHSSLPAPGGQELLVADLGLDRLFRYRIGKRGKLVPNEVQPWAEVAPGQGPRHFTFHPNGEWLYLVNELGKTIHSFRYRGAEAELEYKAEYDISQPKTPGSLAADICFAPNGKYLYASVRGTDRIFCFHWQDNGHLEPGGSFFCGGQGPRSFHISSDGAFLAAANQDSGNITVFPLDQATGALGKPAAEFSFPQVSCVKFGRTET